MSYRFQKIYYTVLFTLFLACSPDYDFEIEPYTFVPEALVIKEEVGIKLDSNFATSKMKMNVKLNSTGNYYIKVLDITGKVVAKELVNGRIGNNIFTVYTSTLPKSSYRLELFNDDKKVGATSINLL
jgi:hypothetical protein